MTIRIEVIGDDAKTVLTELAQIAKTLIQGGVPEDTIQTVGKVAGQPVKNDDILDGNTARENALNLLRKHYEDQSLRPALRKLLDQFNVKAFGDVKADQGVSFLARVIEILNENGKQA
jgi:hypothetical protein